MCKKHRGIQLICVPWCFCIVRLKDVMLFELFLITIYQIQKMLRPVTVGADSICPKRPVYIVCYISLFAQIYNKPVGNSLCAVPPSCGKCYDVLHCLHLWYSFFLSLFDGKNKSFHRLRGPPPFRQGRL